MYNPITMKSVANNFGVELGVAKVGIWKDKSTRFTLLKRETFVPPAGSARRPGGSVWRRSPFLPDIRTRPRRPQLRRGYRLII